MYCNTALIDCYPWCPSGAHVLGLLVGSISVTPREASRWLRLPMQNEHGISVKGSARVPAHERLSESSATRMINASSRNVMAAVVVMILAFVVSTVVPTTLLIIFTRDLMTKEAGSVSAHSAGGAVNYLTDRKGSPITSGNTLYQLDLVVERAGVTNEGEITAEAQSFVLFDADPTARLGAFGNRAHMLAFLPTIDTITLAMGTVDNPVTLEYSVEGFIASKERVTFKMNGATGDLDFHLLSDEGGVWATIGDADYAGPGHMNDGTECTENQACDHKHMSKQEAMVCGQDGVICQERCSPGPGCSATRRRTPPAFGGPAARRAGRMLEEGKSHPCATCTTVGAAVASGVSSGIKEDKTVSGERHTGAARGRWW